MSDNFRRKPVQGASSLSRLSEKANKSKIQNKSEELGPSLAEDHQVEPLVQLLATREYSSIVGYDGTELRIYKIEPEEVPLEAWD